MNPTSLLELIGNTPMVEIRHLNPNPDVRILAKLEYLNPGGSIKDRAALFMIEAAERSGELTPEKTVVEATSGNTGIGLAMVCAIKGYKLLLTMSESASVERRQILKARGADIRLTPGHMGTDGAIEEAYRLAREHPDAYFITDQYNNPANWQAHYTGTANEIIEQTNGEVTTVVATLGTSGTLMGLSRRLKEVSSDIRIIGVEPYLGHKIQGLKNMKESYRPEIFEKERLDHLVHIDDDKAFETTRKLAREEGLFVGMSSGAAVAAAIAQADAMSGGTIVVILPDGGERYLSTPLFADQEKIGLMLFNTLQRAKTAFTPMAPGKVCLYTNGPTTYAAIDVAEARRFVFADLVDRYLTYRGYTVQHVMNITDMDDKTYHAADSAGMTPEVFADQNIRDFERDRNVLGIKAASEYPRSSTHVTDMVQIVGELVSKGYAYEKLQSLYFNIARFEDYGRLSGVNLDKIRLGATVDLDEYEKDNPRDFTLLKRVKLSELKKGLYTKTRWGNVRPSWPLQCVTMALKYLGETCDIHIAGRELMFPLHENEIAIAGALNKKPLARFWLHCDRVLVDGKKLGAGADHPTVNALIERGWSGPEIRFWLISSHYRKPAVFSEEQLHFSRRSLKRFDACLANLKQLKEGKPYGELDQLLYDLKSGFIEAMDDDFNVSAALAVLFKVVKRINRLTSIGFFTQVQIQKLLQALRQIDSVLKLFDFEGERIDAQVADVMRKREQARKEGNWKLADQLRDQLIRMGVTVRDPKTTSIGIH